MWYLRQALRVSGDYEGVRETVLGVLDEQPEDGLRMGERLRLLQGSIELGLLTREEIGEYTHASTLLKFANDLEPERRTRDWISERIAGKRASFYKLDK